MPRKKKPSHRFVNVRFTVEEAERLDRAVKSDANDVSGEPVNRSVVVRMAVRRYCDAIMVK